MEIVRGMTTFDGVAEDNEGNIVCEKCGKTTNTHRVFHADAKDYYITTLECSCGNIINTLTYRTEEEKLYWDDDEEIGEEV